MHYSKMIVDVVHGSKYKGYDIEGWKSHFDIKASKDFTQLVKDLNIMEEECILMRDAHGRYFTLEALDCFSGVLKCNAKGFGFVENETTSVYANKGEIRKALDGDTVLAKRIHNKDESIECEILRVLNHSKQTIVGVIKKRDKRCWFLPDTPMPERTFKITNIKDFKLVNDTKVQVYIDKFTQPLQCSIIQIIGHKYDPGIDVLSILLEHDIEPEFPKGVMKEVNKIAEDITSADKKGRLDLTGEITITIDGDDSKDLDDAIHVKRIEGGYQLGVHIADVSHYVQARSELDKEAYERATSVYVVDRVVPMLPHALSNGICSLNPKVERLTLSCIMDIDDKGHMFNYQIVPSFIKTTERMTYTNVNRMIAKDEKMCRRFESIVDMVQLMEELSLLLRKRRHDTGNIDFDTKESKIIVDKKGKVKDIVLRERGESERIIEDFMIRANECVAAHVSFMDLPSIYRVHEVPEAKKIREFVGVANSLGFALKGDVHNVYPKQFQQMLEKAKDSPSFSVLSTYMLRSMRKARYDVNCLGHFGLALKEYTHFTSPIRRYPDLIVHRMLRKHFFTTIEDVKSIENDIAWIEEAAIHTSQKERQAIEAERDVDDMKKCEYMEKFIGAKYDGVISSVTKFGMFIQLPNTVEGLVHISNMQDDYYRFDEVSKTLVGERTKRAYRMGEKVRVRLLDASKFKKQIDFEIIGR